MLKHLYIKNFALIDVLDIDFFSGFSVITGETGAGKSIILGAIGLLLGQRTDTKSIKADSQKCTIEATFDTNGQNIKEWLTENDLECDDDDCIIRREITASGKSRGFINDTPVTLNQMKELGEMLLDVHSQHKNLLLQKEDFQQGVLDIIADNSTLLTEYKQAYAQYKKLDAELEQLRHSVEESKEKEDFMRFQLTELTNANLTPGEQEELEQEQRVASHTEEIKSLMFDADALLNNDDNGIVSALHQACQRITNAADINPKIQPLAERLNSALIDIKDIASECANESENIEYDPERLAFINERLDTIYSLQRKYDATDVSSLCEIRDNLSQAIDNIDNFDGLLTEKEAEVELAHRNTQEKANALTTTRKDAVQPLQTQITTYLSALGIPNANFVIDIQPTTLNANGQDKVQYLFSANKGMPARPVEQVASGGEIARLMLSLKAIISGAVKLPTIIFDEIDTGVSGKVAEQMARIMQEMGHSERQVISITHLPQIASAGQYHYKVEKHDTEEGTTSVMRQLSKDERVMEIAQMLSGTDVSNAALANAKALLRNAD